MGGRWVLLWVQGGGFTNYLWSQSRDKYVWDSTFDWVCHSPRTHSKWEVSGLAGKVGRSVSLQGWGCESQPHQSWSTQQICASPSVIIKSRQCYNQEPVPLFCPKDRRWLISSTQRWIRCHLRGTFHNVSSAAPLLHLWGNSDQSKQQQTVCLIWSYRAAERRDETRNIKCGVQSWEHTGDSWEKDQHVAKKKICNLTLLWEKTACCLKACYRGFYGTLHFIIMVLLLI